MLVAIFRYAQASLNTLSGIAVENGVAVADESLVAGTALQPRLRGEVQHEEVVVVEGRNQSDKLSPTAIAPQAEQLAGPPSALRPAVLAPVHGGEEASIEKGNSSSEPAATVHHSEPSATILTGGRSSLRSFGSGSARHSTELLNDNALLSMKSKSAPVGEPRTIGVAQPESIVQGGPKELHSFGAAGEAVAISSTAPGQLSNDSAVGTPPLVTMNDAPPVAAEDKPTFRLLHVALLFVVVPLVLLLSKAGLLPGCRSKAGSTKEDAARLMRATKWLEEWRSMKDRDMDNVSAAA